MNLQRKTYETRNEKIIDFIIGFVGWFILNGLMGLLVYGLFFGAAALGSSAPGSQMPEIINSLIGIIGLICSSAPLLLNLAIIIYFALTRYWISLGAIAAFVTAQLIALCLALLFVGVCFAALSGVR